MTQREFIYSAISYLVGKFPWISCRYEFRSFSSTHFIEVLPEETYRNNSEYAKEENSLLLQFIERFPNESICFITKDSPIELSNFEFQQGNLSNYLNLKGIETHAILEYSFDQYLPTIEKMSFPSPFFEGPKVENKINKIQKLDYKPVDSEKLELTYVPNEFILPEISNDYLLLPAA